MTGVEALPADLLAPDGDVHVPAVAHGRLDGVRVAVKDLFDVVGRVTAAGNPTLAAGAPATEHAAAVAALLAAGAEVVGKVATDELAMGMFGANSHYGTPLNPAAVDRVPGGSSSGSAAAVAAGAADLGLGTDTGGSIRVPAAFCGLVGLRPTHGRIDLTGVRPMAPRFDTVGLLARTPDRVAAAFAALAEPVAQRRTCTRLVLLTDLLDLADADLAARTRLSAAGWAARMGVEVVEEPLVPAGAGWPGLREIFWPLMSRALWESNGAWVRAEDPVLGEGIRERILDAGLVTDAEVALAEEQRAALVSRLEALLADGGVAVLPTTVATAPLRTASHAELMAFRDRNLALVVPASLTGAPQVSMPVGRLASTAAGTDAPVGVSLLGLPGDDELLLDLVGVRSATEAAS